MFDVHRLRLLRELSQRGTIAAVAAALGYSPSTVSEQLSRLEREAGVRLLDKVGRGLRLTPAAHLLVEHAGAVLDRLEQAEADLAALATGGGGRLRIAMFPSAAHTLLVPALNELARTAPGLEVTVHVLEHEHALPRLLSHELDLVLTEEYPGHPLPRTPDVHRARLTVDRILLAAPAGAAAPPHIEELAGVPWVLEPAGTAARTWAETLCRDAGFEPRVRYESTDLTLHHHLSDNGLAAALLPELITRGRRTDSLGPLPGEPARILDTAVRPGTRQHPHIKAIRAALTSAATPRPTKSRD
jgi:DNA-binding transcriptional LysR family regulator